MTWTPGVTDDDAQVMIRAVEDIYALVRKQYGKPGQFDPLPTVRIFGSWAIPNLPSDAPYANVMWYVERSLDPSIGQIVGSRYLETVVLEPWQATNPHFDLAMTEMGLLDDVPARKGGAAPRPAALGVTCPGILSLVSTLPFEEISSPELRKLALRHMVAHYFGMLMGIPRHTRSDTLITRGHTYCANTCAMVFTDTPTLALSFAQQEMATGMLYCEHCQRDLAAQIAGFHYGMN